MRITPSRHELEFGEGLSWSPPEGAARYHVWGKTPAFSHADDPAGTSGAGGAAPRWRQLAGYDVAGDAPIAVAGQATTLTLGLDGVTATWEIVAAAFDGLDPELALITALDARGGAISIDRYTLPVPESTGAATIAAQERAYLQSLLNARARVAGAGGLARLDASDGTSIERMDLATLDRRVAEVRARIAWFEQAAAGNVLPRMEFW